MDGKILGTDPSTNTDVSVVTLSGHLLHWGHVVIVLCGNRLRVFWQVSTEKSNVDMMAQTKREREIDKTAQYFCLESFILM